MQKNWDLLWYAFYVFAGIGLELVVLLIEPDQLPVFAHWLIVSAIWGGFGYFLAHSARLEFGLYLSKKRVASAKNVFFAWVLGFVPCILNRMMFHQWKLASEITKLGFPTILAQDLYYVCEAFLVTLLIMFAQDFFESEEMKASKIPWGGIILALTWGLVHSFTRGNLQSGLIISVFSILYGYIYLLNGRNFKLTWLLIAISLIL